jgi:hypothetical protein
LVCGYTLVGSYVDSVSGSPGDPKAVSDLRALIESQNAEIAKIKRSNVDSRRDKEKHMKETWQRHNPDVNPEGDGNTKRGRKKKNTTAPPAPAPAATAAATAAGDGS